MRSHSAVVYAVMSLKICRRHRYTVAFEVFRRPDHNTKVIYELA